MPTQPTTRAQISGYNFLVRRMEHAIVRRDVRMLFDPMRSQSRAFTVGVVLATLVAAGAGVLALVRPQDKIGSNKIVVAQDSGAMYVVLGDAVHPVLNLASARLAAGAADKPIIVKDSELTKRPRGQLIGIPGAPTAMPYDKNGTGKAWTVCDVDDPNQDNMITTSVIVGNPQLGANAAQLAPDHALLVMASDDYTAEQQEIQTDGRSANDHPVYLVYDGKRAVVNRNNPAVVAGLNLTGVAPRPVSRGLLNAIPLVPEIVPPNISGMGSAPNLTLQDGSSWPSDYKIGSVLYVVGQNGDRQYYVVLNDGLQKVSEATASVVLEMNNQTTAALITPAMQANAPASTDLDKQIADYPQHKPTAIDTPDTAPVSCLSWKPLGAIKDRANNDTSAELSILAGRSLPVSSDAKPITLIPPADSSGYTVQADNVYIGPGTGDFVQTTGIEPNSKRGDNFFYVADTGTKYGIEAVSGDQTGNDDAMKALGLNPSDAEPAPDQIVSLLGDGPTLSRKAAMVAHDGMTGDPDATSIPTTVPNN